MMTLRLAAIRGLAVGDTDNRQRIPEKLAPGYFLLRLVEGMC